MELIEGAMVASRYRLERKLGAGGMGEVWAASQTVTRMPVAIKFLRDGSSSEEARRRFLREARAAVAVRHPNVVQIHDVLELADGEPVMIMELLEGESLEQRIRRDGRIPLGELCAVMLRVVAAVGTAHELGIVHRDLKPDNIFLAATREGIDVKVLDFGIAKMTAVEGSTAETGGLTSTGAMLGTPYYMSPEQAFGEKRIDHRADLWSLGVILYRCLTGVLPTYGENIGQILKIIMTNSIVPLGELAPEMPRDVSDLVGRMLSQAPAQRPRDLREVRAVLERYAGITVDPFGPPMNAPADPPTGASAASASAPVPSARAPGPSVAARSGRTNVLTVAVAGAALALVVAAVLVKPAARGGAHDAKPEGTTAAATAAPTATTPGEGSVASSATAVPSSAAVPMPPTASSAAPTASVVSRRARAAPTAAPTVEAAHEPAKPSMGGVISKPPF